MSGKVGLQGGIFLDVRAKLRLALATGLLGLRQ